MPVPATISRLLQDLRPEELSADIGVYTKFAGSRSDWSWVATSQGFEPEKEGLHHLFVPGKRKQAKSAVAWRADPVGQQFLAFSDQRSSARDGFGRGIFLERRVLRWRSMPDLHPGIAALHLLDAAARLPSGHSKQSNSFPGSEARLRLAGPQRIQIDRARTQELCERGLAELRERLAGASTSIAAMTGFYNRLIAGAGPPAYISGQDKPVSPHALSCLLLPLPPDIARRVSLAAWSHENPPPHAKLADGGWDAVFTRNQPRSAPEVQLEERPEARAATNVVLGIKDDMDHSPTPSTAQTASSPGTTIALWGGPGHGKTMTLGRLSGISDNLADGWRVVPTTETADEARALRERVYHEGRFPEATGESETNHYAYRLEHENYGTATLKVDDRAGAIWQKAVERAERGAVGRSTPGEQHKASAHATLVEADAMILLFDAGALSNRFYNILYATLEEIFHAGGSSQVCDPRPIAFCLTKADILIRNPEDFIRATCPRGRRELVEERVRSAKAEEILSLIKMFCGDFELFPVSAAGVDLRSGVLHPVLFADEMGHQRIRPAVAPVNLLAPLAWIFERLRVRRATPTAVTAPPDRSVHAQP